MFIASLARDQMEVCPFDKVHVVHRDRLTRHIAKCQKQHPDKQLVSCPLNCNHKVLKDPKDQNMRAHLDVCPDRRNIVQHYTQMNTCHDGRSSALPTPAYLHRDRSPNGENWDDNDEQPRRVYIHGQLRDEMDCYNPDILAGMTKSEKKQFYQSRDARLKKSPSQFRDVDDEDLEFDERDDLCDDDGEEEQEGERMREGEIPNDVPWRAARREVAGVATVGANLGRGMSSRLTPAARPGDDRLLLPSQMLARARNNGQQTSSNENVVQVGKACFPTSLNVPPGFGNSR